MTTVRLEVTLDVKHYYGPKLNGDELGPALADALDGELPTDLYLDVDGEDEEAQYQVGTTSVKVVG